MCVRLSGTYTGWRLKRDDNVENFSHRDKSQSYTASWVEIVIVRGTGLLVLLTN